MGDPAGPEAAVRLTTESRGGRLYWILLEGVHVVATSTRGYPNATVALSAGRLALLSATIGEQEERVRNHTTTVGFFLGILLTLAFLGAWRWIGG